MRESGQSIADYQIVKPLTENPLFATYQVTGAGGDSAKLLLISVEQLVDKSSRQAFLAQAQLLLGQSFPGLCCLLAAETSDLQSYCVYPFPEGAPLTESLSQPFPVRRALEIGRQTALHLSSAHAAGLWHGSVSPATIYLAGDRVSLDQFALASLLPLDFRSGVDPCYSSPELVRGEPLSAAADLYSLGVVLYRLLTGKVPFSAEEPFATAMLHVQEQAAPLPATMSQLQPLLDGLLAAVPGERWSAEQLVVELDLLLQLSELDSLAMPAEETTGDETGLAPDEDAVDGGTEQDEVKLAQRMSNADLTARIEQRLQERAAALRESENLSQNAQRASTERMTAISRQSYRKTKDMPYIYQQKKSGGSRFVVLSAVGIAVGVIIYLTVFGGLDTASQTADQLPAALVTGLKAGSQELQQGDLAAAEATFSRLLEDFALYPQAYNNLAAVYAQQGDLERARDVLERAMATEEAYAVIYRNLGTVYSEMARDSYGRALQLENGQPALALQLFGGEQLQLVATAAVETAPPAAEPEQSDQQPDAETADTVEALAEEPQQPAAVEPVDAVAVVVTEDENEAVQPVVEEIVPQGPEAVEAVLQRWAAAWSAQDVPAYLSFYAPDFTPSAGRSREDWERQRQTRLTRPQSIEVSLSDFALVGQSEGAMQFEVTQVYKSDRYADQTRKLFDMVLVDNDWQIARERSLGRVR